MLEKAPNFFWYSLSICMLWMVTTISIISYRSSEITLGFADTKIALTHAAIDLQKEYETLKTNETNNNEAFILLQQENNELKKKLENMGRRDLLPTTRPSRNIKKDIDYEKNLDKIKNISQQLAK